MIAALTAPFAPEWTSRLGSALGITCGVAVAGHTLGVTSGTLTWDEDSTPHVQARVQCAAPTDQAVLDALDPRLNARMSVVAGYRVPGTRESHQIADLVLTDRITQRPENLLNLAAVSDELRVLDTRPLNGSRSFNASSDGGAAIRELIRWDAVSWSAFGGLPPVDVTATGAFVPVGDSLLIDREDDLWSAIQDIADRIGAWVYHDGLGRFHVVPQPTRAGPAAASLAVGVGGTITASEASLSRDDWANTVVVIYEWFDGSAQRAVGYAEVTSGPYAVTAVGRKTKTVTIPRKGTTAQAKAAAASMVSRAVTRGRGLSIECEHLPLWARPGMTATVQLPTGPQERHLISRVDLDIPSGRGHITTRLPENVTITTGE